MQHHTIARFLFPSLFLATLAGVACTPPAQEAKEPADITPEGPLDGVEAEAVSSKDDAATAETKKFDDMAPGEKLNYMKTVVMPQMKPVFQEFDAEEFGGFGCSTCHGAGAKDGNFEMPNPELPALNKEEMDEHPEMTKFMMEKVTPKMAELMGEEPGPEGFGCFDCHTKKD